MDYLPAQPPWKPKNTGMGSLSFLQADLPNPGIKPESPALQADSLPTELSHAKLLPSCTILCSLMNCSPPGSFVRGSFQARILEWVAISYPRGLNKLLKNHWLSFIRNSWASLIAQLVKNPPAMQETLVHFLGGEDPLEKG